MGGLPAHGTPTGRVSRNSRRDLFEPCSDLPPRGGIITGAACDYPVVARVIATDGIAGIPGSGLVRGKHEKQRAERPLFLSTVARALDAGKPSEPIIRNRRGTCAPARDGQRNRFAIPDYS